MAKEILGTKVYYDEDCDMGFLKGKKITILGYGSQGHAHALNLKDSGFEVTVGLRKESAAWSVAEKDGFQVKITGEAVRDADVVMVLIPDEVQGEIYTQDIAPNLKEGAYLGFGHGFFLVKIFSPSKLRKCWPQLIQNQNDQLLHLCNHTYFLYR